MLSVLESMRRIVFGGPSGMMVARLGVKGASGTGALVNKDAGKRDWLLAAVGGGRVHQKTVAEMGRYIDVLAR
jgi:hypothetical protein